MCGIAGFFDTSGSKEEELTSVATDMTDTLHHRGPDAGGVWADAGAGIALGSRRLSIHDLSPLGHQPMRSADARYVLVFNGEIYNFGDLRRRLEGLGHRFRGNSDTEVLLAAIVEWGLVGALERSNGMFALALWDRSERILHLARDRMGEKPLYYGWSGRTFLFGSELKAMRAHPGFTANLDRDALTLFFRYKYIPGPWSIFEGIRKLAPGSYLSIRPAEIGFLPEPQPYWDPSVAALHAEGSPFGGSPDDAADQLNGLLGDAVRLRMESDVPLGALLSGGIDSSTVVALMQSVSERPVATFTLGFGEAAFDESSSAAAVAQHLGTNHTNLRVSATDALDVIPLLSVLYDEPFADSSQIPTYLVSKLARTAVTVALSGDGGDELFGGYNRYSLVPTLARLNDNLPRPARRAAARGLELFTPAGWERVVRIAGPALPRRFRHRTPGDKVQKVVDSLRADDEASMYLGLVTHWPEPGSVVEGGHEPRTPITERSTWPEIADFRQQMMYLDAISYLPEDILAKVDRASMGVGLEVRVPFLDHRVVEFAWSLPADLKIKSGVGKQPVRRLLDRYVPPGLVDRPKMGFGVPLGDWLRGPLREWTETLLEPSRMQAEGFLSPQPVREAWAEHLSGRRNRQYLLWDVLMFQAWLEAQQVPAAASAH